MYCKHPLLYLLVCVVAICFARNTDRTSGSKVGGRTLYLTQKIDHYNPEDKRTFQQKYYIDDTYWEIDKGPIFLVISGEGPLDGLPSNEVQVLASKFRALIVSLEHRYYGDSNPFPLFTTENLKYLNTQQALFDLAMFVDYINKQIEGTSGWITFGCSYAGALAAWFRLKFPHLTKGSISSSGVVDAVLDFTEFDEQVQQSAGEQCTNILIQITSEIETQLFTSPETNAKVKEMFQAKGFPDGDFLFLTADISAESVQYGYGKSMCNFLENAKAKGRDLLAAFVNYTISSYYPVFGGPEGYNTSKQQELQAPNGDRAWWFQQCSELGYFQNAPKIKSIRSTWVNMTYHRNHCRDVFGMDLWPDTEATNNYYGGKNISGSNIFFLNSSQDPWQRASVEISHTAEPIEIVKCDNCGHCSDVRGCPSLPTTFNLNGCDNMNSVTHARTRISEAISKWLSK